ncbi:MAG: GNAT family N-acetyltransferase [Eudoraea sp.]|nr:GNAT family N-acetyltransferase [Eudoraea sp.]
MNCTFSTDKEKLNVMALSEFIRKETYWGKERALEEVQHTIDHSLCFGMYDPTDTQIGFARVITDYVVFPYLMDVIIFKAQQGKGFGKQMIRHILEHDSLKRIQTFALKTRDAQELYRQFGFETIGGSQLWMAKDNNVYI